MRKELKKGDTEYDMFNDFWQLCKQYNIPEESDEYWQSLVQATDAFCKKYPSKFARDIALAYCESRELIYNA